MSIKMNKVTIKPQSVPVEPTLGDLEPGQLFRFQSSSGYNVYMRVSNCVKMMTKEVSYVSMSSGSIYTGNPYTKVDKIHNIEITGMR